MIRDDSPARRCPRRILAPRWSCWCAIGGDVVLFVVETSCSRRPFAVIGAVLLLLDLHLRSSSGPVRWSIPTRHGVLPAIRSLRGHGQRPGPALGQPVATRNDESPFASATSRTDRSKRQRSPFGNPIEIASVVVWKVVDTAESELSTLDDYGQLRMHVQSESADTWTSRRSHPYDTRDDRADLAARQHRGDRRSTEDRDPGCGPAQGGEPLRCV